MPAESNLTKFTPMTLSAIDGLTNNQTLAIHPDLITAMNAFINYPEVASHRSAINAIKSFLDTAINPDPVYASTLAELQNISIISDYNNINMQHYDDIIARQGSYTTSSPSLSTSKILQHLGTVTSTVTVLNGTIGSADKAGDFQKQSFTNSNDLASGNLTAVTSDPLLFGNDLKNTGTYLDLSEIKNIGAPHGLLDALIRSNMLVTLRSEFAATGVNTNSISAAMISNPDLQLKPIVQKAVYAVAKEVTGSKLTNILIVLDVVTDNITTLSDLLDLRKLFPNSFDTLKYNNTLIYNGTNLASNVSELTTPLLSVLTEDIIKPSIAFQRSMQTIKNISTITPSSLSAAYLNLTETTGLATINTRTEAVPASVITQIQTDVANGTDAGGTYKLEAAVRSVLNSSHMDLYIKIVETLDQINLGNLGTLFTDIETAVIAEDADALAGTTVAPLTDGLLLELQNELVIYNSNAAAFSIATEFTLSKDDLFIERFLEDPNFPIFPVMRDTDIMRYASSLTTLTDPEMLDILNRLAADNGAGEALKASLIEGKNTRKLQEAGLNVDPSI